MSVTTGCVEPHSHAEPLAEDEDHELLPARGMRDRRIGLLVGSLVVGAVLACVVGIATGGWKMEASRANPVVTNVGQQLELDDTLDLIANHLSGIPGRADGNMRYVVFRCRDFDHASGFGDRLAGLFGAAFFAMTSLRVLKIDWPEFQEIYTTNKVDWNYLPDMMGISPEDQGILNSRFFSDVPGMTDPTFQGIRDVYVTNFWNLDSPGLWRGYPSSFATDSELSPVVVMTANRGGTVSWYQTLQEAGTLPDMDYWSVYRLIWEALFSFQPAFLDSPFVLKVSGFDASGTKQMVYTSVTMRMVLLDLAQYGTWSLGVHIRCGDAVIQGEKEGMDCESLDPAYDYLTRISCIETLAAQQSASKKILVVFSDSKCAKNHIMDTLHAQSNTFSEIWTQEFKSDVVNIDTSMSGVGEAAKDGFFQSMVDWNLMRAVNSFALTSANTFISGFPASALITAGVSDSIYDLMSCFPMTSEKLCAERFC